jgi:hypothetical protein
MKTALLLGAAGGFLLALPLLASKSAPAADAVKAGDKIPAFKATVTSVLDSQTQGTLTAYHVVGVKCPATPRYVERMKTLEAGYRAKGVEFVYVFPNKTEDAETKQKWFEEQGFKGMFLNDADASIARSLGSKKTAEVFLVDKAGTVLYRGGIDDNLDASKASKHFVAAALDEHLANKEVTTKSGPVFG